MASLYEINSIIDDLLNSDYQANEELVNNESGEINTLENILDGLEIDFKEKVDNIACFIKNLNADIEALKTEEKALAERRRIKENKVENLKRYLTDGLIQAGYTKFETPRCSVSFRKSKSLDIGEGADIPEAFMITKTEQVPNKKAIKEAIEGGMLIDGVAIHENNNIQIK